ncbi:MAG: Hemolysin containing domain-like protein [Frankiales bacterium]|jgi:CBS domain containing-hemolysin-like protein|nr:Hemolysin containing domain-like protein [Frankiales bacterium]
MTRTVLGPLLIAVGFVLLAGLLACLEVALARVSRVRVEELRAEGRAGAVRLAQLLTDPPRTLNLLLLLRLAAELAAAGIVTSYCVDRIPGSQAVALAVVVMVVVSYVFIGVAPRTIGRQQAERVALIGAPVALALTRVFGPLPSFLILVGNALTPGKGLREGPFASEAELRDLVDRAQERGVVEEAERDMIENVFDLGDTIVREVMVPRTDMVFIEREKTVRQALNLALRSGFSRIPVVGENADDVVGVAYLKDLVRKERADGGAARSVEEVLREPVFVPESKPVDDLLREMQASLGHIAFVVDEYGGTAGLVTIEDVLEEIVGEITDEYDREAPPVERLAGGQVRVTSRLPVEDLEELYDVELPHENVDSVGGLLASELGRVPIPGATVRVGGLELVAESAKGRRNRIGTVLVTRLPPDITDMSDEQEETAGAGPGS